MKNNARNHIAYLTISMPRRSADSTVHYGN